MAVPKFKHQPQRVPGIARKVRPKPDHGEDSYCETGRLPNRKVFTRALARQVAEDGIRVNCVAPDPVWTPRQTSGGQPYKKIAEFGTQTPMKRPGQALEMAHFTSYRLLRNRAT
jgi:hypothetical protein